MNAFQDVTFGHSVVLRFFEFVFCCWFSMYFRWLVSASAERNLNRLGRCAFPYGDAWSGLALRGWEPSF